MIERRSGGPDRRCNLSENAYGKLPANAAYLAMDDRRKIPDRRLNNIHLEEIDCDEFIRSISKKV